MKNDEPYYYSTHKETYAPTIDNFRKSWVSISEMEVRMIPMETKAIPISLFIPKDVEITEKYWSFIINAVGQDIIKETESVVINTVKRYYLRIKNSKQDIQRRFKLSQCAIRFSRR